jgi:hypothetical protein
MKAIFLGLMYCVAQAGAAEKGFTPLFNGKNLDGWQGVGGPTTNWKIADSVLSCTGKPGSHWIATRGQYADFDLRLEFNTPGNGNSGVFIRAPKGGAPWVDGLEIQVLDDHGGKYKTLKPAQYTGSVYAIQAPSKRVTKKADTWQTMRILCEGAKCDVWINGQHVVKANLAELAKTHEQPGLKRKTGFIGLQNHASPMHFRNIRVKHLD